MEILKLINPQNFISLIIGGLITFLIYFYFDRKKRLLLRYKLLNPISFQLPSDIGKTGKQLRTQTLILKNSSRHAADNVQIRLIKTKFLFPPESNLPANRYSIREYEEDKFIELTSLLVNEEAEFTFFLLNSESISSDKLLISSANAQPMKIEQAYLRDKFVVGAAAALTAIIFSFSVSFLNNFITAKKDSLSKESVKDIVDIVKQREDEAFISGKIWSYITTDKEFTKKLHKFFKNKPYSIKIHTVEPTDTLGNIVDKYKTSVDAIILTNDIEGESSLMFRKYLIVPIQDDTQAEKK